MSSRTPGSSRDWRVALTLVGLLVGFAPEVRAQDPARVAALAESLLEVAGLPSFSVAILRGDSVVHRATELLKRRGRYRPEDFTRLHLTEPIDLPSAKRVWLAALEGAEAFVRGRPSDELGCLDYSTQDEHFVVPDLGTDLGSQGIAAHYGAPGGVIPRVVDSRLEKEKQ